MTFPHFMLWADGIFLALLFVVWKKDDFLNFMIKTIMFFLSIFTIVLACGHWSI